MELPVFQFVSIVSGALTGHHWKEPLPILFAPSLQLFVYTDKIPMSLFFFRLSSPNSLGLPWYDGCFSLLIIFAALCWTHSGSSMSLVYWKAQHWTKLSRCGFSRAEYRQRITTCDLLAALLIAAGTLLASFVPRACFWLVFSFVSLWKSRSFSSNLLSSFERNYNSKYFYQSWKSQFLLWFSL